MSATGPRRPIAVLLCGPSGSGKTTVAHRLVAQGYVRVSIDELVRERFGRYGEELPVERYQEANDAVEDEFRRRVRRHLEVGDDVVLDRAMWQRREREEYKALVTEAGGEWRLLYLAVPAEELRRRVALRRVRGDADAFPATDELLEEFLATFEVPDGEGEEVLRPPEV